MALSRSLSTGASSLRAQQRSFDVISNNIANVNTIGFKSSRANFLDQFYQTYFHGKAPETGTGAGGLNPMQIGLGVRIGSITMNTAQGVIESTERPLDLALQGEGFFVYNLNGRDLYSRAGAIVRDMDGFFVDSSTGAYLQGYNIETDANGMILKDAAGANVLNRMVGNIKIGSNTISPPGQTQNITITGNLNSSNPTDTERKTSIKIYDNVGGVHQLTLIFTKTANANEYSVAAQVDDIDVTLSATTVTFNNDGTLNTPLNLTVNAADINTALTTQVFDATTPKNISIQLADANNILGGLTMFSGPNSATASEQDGYQSGELQSLSVDEQGKIWGAFTNGQSEILGQVVIAKFTNPGALTKEGMNFFTTSPNSGEANIGTAGEIFPSTLVAAGSLEQSNVDLTEEFVNIISTQRAFEAAARIITVTDQMLGETTLLKR